MSANHPLTWQVFGALLVCASAASGMAMARTPPAAATGRNLIFSPYKYVPRNVEPDSNALRIAVTGLPTPLVGNGGLLPEHMPDLHAITLAFANGECGNESWNGVSAAAIAKVAVPELSHAGIDYIISTGGDGHKFTCAATEAFADFIRRYLSPHMLGVDFDIEYNQTPAEVTVLVADAAHAQKLFPHLRFSFTLATWAGSDGKHAGLNSLGDTVMKAIKASALDHYTINLMVMDYGKTSPGTCVVVHGVCDMGQSAIQAVKNLQRTWSIPAGKIEVTPIIGVNDNADEIFTLSDMDVMVRYAVANGLAGIHFWSLDRDTPCPAPPNDKAKPSVCNGTGDPPLAFTRRVLHDLGR